MNREKTAQELRKCAEFIRQTHLQIGEKTAIERLLSCALKIEKIAEELKEDEVGNEQK